MKEERKAGKITSIRISETGDGDLFVALSTDLPMHREPSGWWERLQARFGKKFYHVVYLDFEELE